jgi:hypothetical protein
MRDVLIPALSLKREFEPKAVDFSEKVESVRSVRFACIVWTGQDEKCRWPQREVVEGPVSLDRNFSDVHWLSNSEPGEGSSKAAA